MRIAILATYTKFTPQKKTHWSTLSLFPLSSSWSPDRQSFHNRQSIIGERTSAVQLLFEFFTIEERPEYRPLGDFTSVPEACWPRRQVENKGRACIQVLFLSKAELGFFHFLEIVTGWLVPSASQKIPVQRGWYLPPHKIPLAENRFLQACKGAENTNEKSRQCFTYIKNRFW
jgi:hypothetical protein